MQISGDRGRSAVVRRPPLYNLNNGFLLCLLFCIAIAAADTAFTVNCIVHLHTTVRLLNIPEIGNFRGIYQIEQNSNSYLIFE
jgi:hypothetical protein